MERYADPLGDASSDAVPEDTSVTPAYDALLAMLPPVKNPLDDLDEALYANGWNPIPVHAASKRPLIKEWPIPRTPEALRDLRQRHPDHLSTGVLTGEVVGVDLDAHGAVFTSERGYDHSAEYTDIPADYTGPLSGDAFTNALKKIAFDVFGETLMERVGAKDAMLIYRNSGEPLPKMKVGGTHPTMKRKTIHSHAQFGPQPAFTEEKVEPLQITVEVLGKGQQFVAYGDHPQTGQPYRWIYALSGMEPAKYSVRHLVEVTPEQIKDFVARVHAQLLTWGFTDVRMTDRTAMPEKVDSLGRDEKEPIPCSQMDEVLRYALRDDDMNDRQTWIARLGAILATPLADEDGNRLEPDEHDEMTLEFADRASRGDYSTMPVTNYEGRDDVEHTLGTLDPDEGATFGTLIHDARENGYVGRLPQHKVNWNNIAVPSEVKEAAARVGELVQTVALSEDSMAVVFTNQYRDRLCYDEVAGWTLYDGRRWQRTSVPAVWNAIKPITRAHANALQDNESLRRKLVSRSTVAGVEALARGDLLVPSDIWDAVPWVLNTPIGVVDLRTGELRTSTPTDYCMKMTKYGPAETANCPMWQKFMSEITRGDAGLAGYLQRAFGLSLIGQVIEHVLFFCYGPGGNGKGTLLESVSTILNDYAQVAPMSLFTEKQNQEHPTSVARLQGARLVRSQETRTGSYWDDAQIKTLTGGDRLTGRFMRQDFFEFDPQFTIFVAGNHKPSLRRVSDGERQRLHLVPFQAKFRGTPADIKSLGPQMLATEASAILRWLIDGCLEYQRLGRLLPPPAVLNATAEYFGEQDPLTAWREACFDPSATASDWTSLADLFQSYTTMSRSPGASAPIYTEKLFKAMLEAAGFTPHKRNTGQGFYGIRLRR